MSIRIVLLTLLVIALAIYAWRDWYKSLCGLILLMAVIEHPDMPKKIMGIPGLNPWNLLMVVILLVWVVTRRREGLVWDMPRHMTALLLLYLGVIVVSLVRMMVDPTGIEYFTFLDLLTEYLINSVKWVIPGLLLFDGCRTRPRLKWAVGCIVALYLLLAVQVIRQVPPGAAVRGGDELAEMVSAPIQKNIGYSRVTVSMLLAGASWAVLATMPLMKRRWQQVLVFAAFAIVAYAQALTGGRMGYVTWGIVGLILCLFKWRRMLLIAPLIPIAVAIAMPGVAERMLQGVGVTSATGEKTLDHAELTSDRLLIWPSVIDKIMESPGTGYGREAMIRTGLNADSQGLYFNHPHNAYLECLLDNGLAGFVPVIVFYILVTAYAMRLFLDSREPWCAVVGGITCALVLALLVASMGSHSFYPRQWAVGMWAAIGLTLRLHREKCRISTVASGIPWPVRPAAARSEGHPCPA